jgi:hypothetical protein
MITVNKLSQYVEKLPQPLQAEVLHFVEYLLSKAERDNGKQEERNWSDLSLSLAMRGMEEEASPKYTTTDLKVIFS